MNLNRWLSVIVMLGLILILSPLGAQADPYPPLNLTRIITAPMGRPMGGMAAGRMGMTVTRSNSGAPVRGRTSPGPICVKFTPDRRRSPMSRPLPPSLAFSKSRNPNPFTPSPDLQASMGKSTFE